MRGLKPLIVALSAILLLAQGRPTPRSNRVERPIVERNTHIESARREQNLERILAEAGVDRQTAVQRIRNFRAANSALYGAFSSFSLKVQHRATLRPRLTARTAKPYSERVQSPGDGFPFILADVQRPTTQQMLRGGPIKANVAIIDLLPKTREEYSSVFKREGVSQGAEAEMASSEQVIQNTFGRLRHRADDVVTALPDVSADIVVIIGHNESGLLRTPSGKIINIFEASRGCLTAGKFCIFLTCRSADYLSELQLGVTRDLGIVEASRIAKEISESMGRERLIEVPRTSREQIQGVAASFQLADPQGAMSRLTKIVAGQRRSIYLGFIERGVFIIVAAILVGDDE